MTIIRANDIARRKSKIYCIASQAYEQHETFIRDLQFAISMCTRNILYFKQFNISMEYFRRCILMRLKYPKTVTTDLIDYVKGNNEK